MKQNERIFTALSGIDTDMITAAAPGKQRRQPGSWKKWLPTAACFALAAVIGIAAWRMHTPKTTEKDDKLYAETVVLNTEAATATSMETAIVPRWEEMTISAQYGEFHVGEQRFSTRVTTIDAANVGEKLGQSTAQGYDIYTDTAHQITLDYYAIRGIGTECALAVRFEGEDGYYVYVNSWYRPDTLEDLITDLNLREHMTFGDFHASGFNEDRNLETVRFHDPDDSIVWEWLLSDTSLENVYDEVGWYGSLLSVSVHIPLLGYENISLWVTEDGHLCTNILDTGKAFYIGEEKVQQFLMYLVLHCPDRTVTVYVTEHDESPMTAVDGEDAVVEMTSQGWNPEDGEYTPPQTASDGTTAAPPYFPATVTATSTPPQITTSNE